MAQRNTSLTEFLESFYKSSTKSSTTKSFDQYLIDTGASYKDKYGRAVEAAYSKRNKGLSGYGTKGEGLSSIGLSASGYAGYLSDKADTNMQRELLSAYGAREASAAKARAGYADYLEKEKQRTESARNGVFDRIVNSGVSDLETAYGIAVAAGLTGDDAMVTAQNALGASKKKLLRKILQTVLTEGLDPNSAGVLAEQMGIGEEFKKDIIAYAESMKGSQADGAEELIKYLEAHGSRDTVSGDRLASALEEYIKMKNEERKNSK